MNKENFREYLNDSWWDMLSIETQAYLIDRLSCKGNGYALKGKDKYEKIFNLTKLFFYMKDISKIDFLIDLPNVKELSFNYVEINSLKELYKFKSFSNIEVFYFQNSSLPQYPAKPIETPHITNLEGIEIFPNLKLLWVQHNYFLTSLKGIENCKKLETLFCFGCKLNSLEGIEDLIYLKRIDCYGNNIKSLQPLANVVNLEYLNCYSNQIDSLMPLSNCGNLKSLAITYNKIISLHGIENCKELEYLSIEECGIDNIEELNSLTRLRVLMAQGNNITSLKSLVNCLELRNLSISNNNINDISPLCKCDKLQIIDLCGNPFTDLNYLLLFPKLSDIHLDSDNVRGNFDKVREIRANYTIDNKKRKVIYTKAN